MKKMTRASLAMMSTLTLTAALAACGGGGGGGSTTPPTGGGGGGGTPPTPVSSTTPAPPNATPTPGTTGQLAINGVPLANDVAVFTCGCNENAGEIKTDGSGNYMIGDSAPAVTGGGTYTPSGHNLLVVGYVPNGSQAWTMQFMADTTAKNLNLGSSTSDTASTAAALYVYYAAGSQLTNTSDKTFDWFNFNQIIAFADHLRAGGTTAEQKLMADIKSEQAAGHPLYPQAAPPWDPVGTKSANATITTDVKAVASGGLGADSTLPTPCPAANACTGAPTP